MKWVARKVPSVSASGDGYSAVLTTMTQQDDLELDYMSNSKDSSEEEDVV